MVERQQGHSSFHRYKTKQEIEDSQAETYRGDDQKKARCRFWMHSPQDNRCDTDTSERRKIDPPATFVYNAKKQWEECGDQQRACKDDHTCHTDLTLSA